MCLIEASPYTCRYLGNHTSFGTKGCMPTGSRVAQLVGCLTDNPRVVGSIPTDANCFIKDNILGQDVNPDCASLSTQGKYG